MNALPQTKRYDLLLTRMIATGETFSEVASIAAQRHTSRGARWVIRDRVTGAYYDPALDPETPRTFSVLSPPNRTPQIGEKWLHRRLGEVEVIDTSTFRPASAEWLVVRRLGEGVDQLRRSVDPADLIGRAE